MAHYAKLDENNIVLEVIVIDNQDCLDDDGNECEENGRRLCEALTGHTKWKKTSRNTRHGVHYETDLVTPSATQNKSFRKNYAFTGCFYDENLDAFIPPKPEMYASWVLNTETAAWEPPIERPTEQDCFWNESIKNWSYLTEQNFMDLQDGTTSTGPDGNLYTWNRVEKTWTQTT